MIFIKKTWLIYILFILIIQSCYYDNAEELYPYTSCDTTGVNFSQVIQPIIVTNCAKSGCHVPGTGRKDLSTYSGVKDIVDDGRLEERVIIQGDMPPSGPLNNCDIAKIETWIENGAPDN